MSGMCVSASHPLLSEILTIYIVKQEDYKIGDPILHIELRRWADVVPRRALLGEHTREDGGRAV